MLHDSISFGISTDDGTAYVRTCRGEVKFETAEKAAAFAHARIGARLNAYLSIWTSFSGDLESHDGDLKADEMIPF